ncbi:hypothetical protein [Hymenobacter persicinus]|uniref:Uncharacterized protein n=1 Tax=Hymenobacter persicinus TaxID=2025506 RepID=A0A4V1ZAL5_9BACT|nr:hypothetical protein [Hymenobacter persicinus]RYU78674.1 hypothetical protein EWM57_12795 [Hymenobacter persicinus]
MFDWDDRTQPFDQFVRVHIPNLDALDQYQEGRARARLARQWVLAHPQQELQLWLRKTVLFFSPENFIADAPRTAYHPVTAVVHAAFLLSLLLGVTGFQGIRLHRPDVLLLTPVVAVWLLSLIFFVGYRWRYFAEPAMLMYPFIIGQRWLSTAKATPRLS